MSSRDVEITGKQWVDDAKTWIVGVKFREATTQVALPFGSSFKDLEDIRWYLEDFASDKGSPFETARASHCRELLSDQATALHTALGLNEFDLSDTRALEIVVRMRNDAKDFFAVSWELLEDPRLWPTDLKVLVRRNFDDGISRQGQWDVADYGLNILLVVSRPNFALDVDYRLISKRIVNIVNNLPNKGLKVTIELVRPGTWVAFKKNLDRYPSGHFQVVHLDVHGSLAERHDTSAIYLNFLRSSGTGTLLVSAEQLGIVLKEHGVQAVLLNACNSARAGRGLSSNFSEILLQCGVSMILGMAYETLSSAAEKFMAEFYGYFLIQCLDWSSSASLARAQVRMHKTRNARFGLQVDVDDWMVPVLYSRKELVFDKALVVPVRSQRIIDRFLAILPSIMETTTMKVESEKHRLWTTEIVGRDSSLLMLETAVLIDYRTEDKQSVKRRLIYIHGPAGCGKTSFVRDIGRWWKSTHFVESEFYFDFADRSWPRTMEAIVAQIFALSSLKPKTGVGSVQAALQHLNKRRFLLVLDSLEAVTVGRSCLDCEERDAITSFLNGLRGGETVILLISRRDAEGWLHIENSQIWPFALGGLSPPSAARMARNFLRHTSENTYDYTDATSSEFLERVLAKLQYLPLAIELVLGSVISREVSEPLSPEHLHQKMIVDGVLPMAPDHLHESIRLLNDIRHDLIGELARLETTNDRDDKMMLNLLLSLGIFQGYMPQNIDRYIGFLTLRDVLSNRSRQAVEMIVKPEYVDKMISLLDPPDLEWFQPFIELRKPALRKLCKMLVSQNMMWEEQVSEPDCGTSFRYWRIHPLLTNQLRFSCSYMAKHDLVEHARETETMRREAFSDYYDRRVIVDWGKASADYAPQARQEIVCELDNLVTAMKIWADSPFFETHRRWLYHVAELFDLNSLTKGEFASLTEALDRLLIRYEVLQNKTEILDDYMLSPAVSAASTLMNVHFASNNWPLASKYNRAVMRLIKTAQEHRELSEGEQSHRDQAKMCLAFEAFHCGRKSEAETTFRANLETPRTNSPGPTTAVSHAKMRFMNMLGLLMCRIEHPKSTKKEIETLATNLEIATEDFYKSSRASGQAAGFADDDEALEKTMPAWREYWPFYKNFLDSARQEAYVDMATLQVQIRRLFSSLDFNQYKRNPSQQGKTHYWPEVISRIDFLGNNESMKDAYLNALTHSMVSGNSATQADWHEELCNLAIRMEEYELALEHNEAWYKMKGDVFNVASDPYTKALYNYKTSFCCFYLKQWPKAENAIQKAIEGAHGSFSRSLLTGFAVHAALIENHAKGGTVEGARWFFIAGILAYETGTYEYHIEKQGWILKQFSSLAIRLCVNGSFVWADLLNEYIDEKAAKQELECFDLLDAFMGRFILGTASEEAYSKSEEEIFLAAALEIKVFQGRT
ncbi:hypothetical protein MMC17_007606 [Xylographa soralifera]|nr:hypothetical protein [Xylographa soralifera]